MAGTSPAMERFDITTTPLHHRPSGGDPATQVLSEAFWMAGTSPAMEIWEPAKAILSPHTDHSNPD